MNAVFYFSVTTVSEKYATNKMCSNLAVILMRGLQKIQSDTRGNALYQETPEHWMRACAETRGIPWLLASSINRKQNVLYLGI